MRNEGVGVGAGAGTPRSAQHPHSSRWQPLWSSTTSLLCLLVACVLLIIKFGIITHRSFSCPLLWIDYQFYCQKHPISCCLLSLFVILLFRCEGQFNHQQYKSITSLFEKNVLRYAENPFKVHLTNLKHFVLSAEAVTRWNRLALKKVITLGHFDYSHQAGGHRSVGASVRSISCMITVPVRPNPSSQP